MKRIAPHPHDDARTITDACAKYSWAAHETAWNTAANRYAPRQGNAWKLPPSKALKGIKKPLYGLYDTRRGSGHIEAIRTLPGATCPMCGSQGRGTVDHFLPRDSYPEFSIHSLNLVPACGHCNSGAKKTTVKGGTPDERFLHPYFDDLLDTPIWQVELQGPMQAPALVAAPLAILTPSQIKTVQFHLTNVLGIVFETTVDDFWATLPHGLIDAWRPDEIVTPAKIATELKRQYLFSKRTLGANAWYTAFLRGVRSNAEAVAHLAHRVATETSPDMLDDEG